MDTQTIENHICEALAGNAQRLALDFAAYLRNQEMQFERGTGYWENERYWHIKYKETYVCFILVNGFGAVRNKDTGKAALGVVVLVGGTALSIVTKGKINPKK